MRRTMILMGILAGLVVLAGSADGQAPATGTKPPPTSASGSTSPPTRKSSLEEAIDLALVNNPDLKVAIAKVREAEASLSRTRLQVLQKVVAAQQGIEEAKASVERAQAQVERIKRLSAAAAISATEVEAGETALAQAKAKLATAQSELDYLLGKPPVKEKTFGSQSFGGASGMGSAFGSGRMGSSTFGPSQTMRWSGFGDQGRVYGWGPRSEALRGPEVDRIRKALDRKVTLQLTDRAASQVLDLLKKEASGLHIQASVNGPAWEERVTATLTGVPFGAALQLLEDVLTSGTVSHRIIVRDYGLLIVRQDKVPPGALMLGEFWQGGGKTATTAPSVRGEVLSLDSKTGLLRISLGSDEGVENGQVLHVVRLGSTESRYLGTLKIIEVKPRESVGQSVTRTTGSTFRTGDKVMPSLR